MVLSSIDSWFYAVLHTTVVYDSLVPFMPYVFDKMVSSLRAMREHPQTAWCGEKKQFSRAFVREEWPDRS